MIDCQHFLLPVMSITYLVHSLNLGRLQALSYYGFGLIQTWYLFLLLRFLRWLAEMAVAGPDFWEGVCLRGGSRSSASAAEKSTRSSEDVCAADIHGETTGGQEMRLEAGSDCKTGS